MRGKDLASLATDLMLAPAVAWLRMPVLLAEANKIGTPGKEALQAVAEKVDAAAEGMVAAQLSFARSAAGFWPEVMSGKVPSVLSGAAMERSVKAALKPASKRVRANFQRLSRKR